MNLEEEFNNCFTIFQASFPQLTKPNLKVRKMRSWGYCAYTNNIIALNSKLINCSPDFVRHVIFHELCHLVYPNHKREFYDLLKQFDPLQQAEDIKVSARARALEEKMQKLLMEET